MEKITHNYLSMYKLYVFLTFKIGTLFANSVTCIGFIFLTLFKNGI